MERDLFDKLNLQIGASAYSGVHCVRTVVCYASGAFHDCPGLEQEHATVLRQVNSGRASRW